MNDSTEGDFRRMLQLKDDEPIPKRMVEMHDGIKKYADALAGDTLGPAVMGLIVYLVANEKTTASTVPLKRGPGRPPKIREVGEIEEVTVGG